MDPAQKLICKALGRLESYQSLSTWQKRGIPFFNTSEEHIQLKQNGANHWLMSFSSSNPVQICDSYQVKSWKTTTTKKTTKERNYQCKSRVMVTTEDCLQLSVQRMYWTDCFLSILILMLPNAQPPTSKSTTSMKGPLV